MGDEARAGPERVVVEQARKAQLIGEVPGQDDIAEHMHARPRGKQWESRDPVTERSVYRVGSRCEPPNQLTWCEPAVGMGLREVFAASLKRRDRVGCAERLDQRRKSCRVFPKSAF